jgi:hypothetical protein
LSLSDEPIPVGRQLEVIYVRQAQQLPPTVQAWLSIAATDSTGNADLILRAADQLELSIGPATRPGPPVWSTSASGSGFVIRWFDPLSTTRRAARSADALTSPWPALLPISACLTPRSGTQPRARR